jgi:alanine dehydrogenase
MLHLRAIADMVPQPTKTRDHQSYEPGNVQTSMNFKPFRTIGLAREITSPENPGGLEKRVALVPDDVAKLVAAGAAVFVERGAGEGVGFSDDEFKGAGATLQAPGAIYKNKDLIIKFKGLALASIRELSPGAAIFCMAHFHSYPERAKMLENGRINVIAMEEVLASPKIQSHADLLGRVAMNAALSPFFADNSMAGLRLRIIEYTPRMGGAIRRAGNRDPRSMTIIRGTTRYSDLNSTGTDSLYFYDSSSFNDAAGLLAELAQSGAHLFDMAAFEETSGRAAVDAYKATHPPLELGMRRIECLHETGQAGARFGFELLRRNKPALDLARAKVVVLGYGNVARGAMDEIYAHGVEQIAILGRTHTNKDRISYWLRDADLIVNGADLSPHLRGIHYLVTNDHVRNLIPKGSVIIDLVGGSETNRSPIEPVINCTFLDAPAFEQDGITISALWGWPMMGMMRETAIRYSGQITDVLLGPDKLLNGLTNSSPGIKRALVCGPF